MYQYTYTYSYLFSGIREYIHTYIYIYIYIYLLKSHRRWKEKKKKIFFPQKHPFAGVWVFKYWILQKNKSCFGCGVWVYTNPRIQGFPLFFKYTGIYMIM